MDSTLPETRSKPYFAVLLIVLKNNVMKELFVAGGSAFMGVLTLLFLGLIVWNVFYFLAFFRSDEKSGTWLQGRFKIGKDIGLFALVVGVMGQMVGLFTAFDYIQGVEFIQSSILAGGLKVSMIPTLYGMIIFLVSLLLYFATSLITNR